MEVLSRSRALWNRTRLDLDSDEVLAQILDRGSLDDWRALYRLMREPGEGGPSLQARVYRILHRVPTGRPYFWLAALASAGYPVDWSEAPRVDEGEAVI
jgi:hypothetical protein